MISLIQNPRRHDITFHANGRIDISAHVARLLNLQSGDVIDVVEYHGEWLLSVKLRAGQYSGRYEGRVFPATRKYRGGTFRTWSRDLCRKALETADPGANRLRCPCGEIINQDNKTYITIIYRCAL